MKRILTLCTVVTLFLSFGIILAACGGATAPKAVAAFTAEAGNKQVVLTWTAGENGGKEITSYELMYSATAGIASAEWSDIGSVTTKTVTELTNGTEYTFKLRAVNEIGAGAEKTATATPAVPQLEAPVLTIDKTTYAPDDYFKWTEIASATSYEFQINGTTETVGSYNTSGGFHREMVSSTLTEPNNYTIKVRAIGDGTNYLTSNWSNTITYTVCIKTLEQFFSAINNIKGNYTVTATYNWDSFLMEYDIQVNGNVSYMTVNYSGEEAGDPVEGSYYRCFLIVGADYYHFYSEDRETWSCAPVMNKNHTVLTEQIVGWWLAISPYSSVTLAVSDFEEIAENIYQAELITLPGGDAVKGTLNYFTIEIQENNRVLIEFEIMDGAKVTTSSMTIIFGAATITEADLPKIPA